MARILLTLAAATLAAPVFAQLPQVLPVPQSVQQTELPPASADTAHPITLQAALELAGARATDVQLAAARVREAVAELDRTRTLWLPTIYLGIDYIRHDGRIQDIVGQVFPTSRSAFMLGAGPSMVFATSDAVFAPLAQKQVVIAREAQLKASENDTLLAVGEAFFNLQQARGDLSGALFAMSRADELVRRSEALSESVVAPVEVARTRAERARRRQAVESARERWRSASAELARLLRLPAGCLVEPCEPPTLKVTLVPVGRCVDELIGVALTHRPELAAQQALVQATLARLRHERLRPLMPSVLLRGTATNPAGTLSSGMFGGGVNSTLTNFGMRNDMDVQVLWELQNLGFGNRARVRAEQARSDQATAELYAVQDRVAAEVVRAHAQVCSAANRALEAEDGLRDALLAEKLSLEGMSQTKQSGRLTTLLIRPQEAVASVQAAAQAYYDYYGAIGDYDRAQFRLYRALGQPPQEMFEAKLDSPSQYQ